jgi:Rod binding domain-containing protein
MSVDFSSLGSVASVGPLDLSQGPDGLSAANGTNDPARVKQVAKAMEKMFINQLTSEMGKSLESVDGSDNSDSTSQGSSYGDFIQQAMTQGVSQGGGFGLAKVIESYLTHGNQRPQPFTLDAIHTPHHAIRSH